jgi:hypothetical protein
MRRVSAVPLPILLQNLIQNLVRDPHLEGILSLPCPCVVHSVYDVLIRAVDVQAVAALYVHLGSPRALCLVAVLPP